MVQLMELAHPRFLPGTRRRARVHSVFAFQSLGRGKFSYSMAWYSRKGFCARRTPQVPSAAKTSSKVTRIAALLLVYRLPARALDKHRGGHHTCPKTALRFSIHLLALSASLVFAQAPEGEFSKKDVMIPARDGVKLHTVVFTPRNAAGPLPILFERTPYGAIGDEKTLRARYDHLIADGYIFAFQDIRGRFGSEGTFVMQRQVRDKADPHAIDETTDAYDSVEWLIHNVPGNNGRAGMLGISYGGWLVTMALLDPHPALKAASEQASPADMFLGDDFHHNGAFRLSYGFEYAAMMETGKTNRTFEFKQYDTYDWYLKLGPLREANARYFDGQRPTWNNFIAHPNYDDFWKRQAVQRIVRPGKVPNLNVSGWFDQEDFAGPWRIFAASETPESRQYNYLVAGPWNHGGWFSGAGRRLKSLDFGSNTGDYFRKNIQARWFAYWLKGRGPLNLSRIQLFEDR